MKDSGERVTSAVCIIQLAWRIISPALSLLRAREVMHKAAEGYFAPCMAAIEQSDFIWLLTSQTRARTLDLRHFDDWAFDDWAIQPVCVYSAGVSTDHAFMCHCCFS
jgi:hypothetical protein